jgi:hypothetical protein
MTSFKEGSKKKRGTSGENEIFKKKQLKRARALGD